MPFATQVKGNNAGSSSCASLIILSKHNRKKLNSGECLTISNFEAGNGKFCPARLQLYPPCVLRRPKLNFDFGGSIQLTSALGTGKRKK